MSFRKNFIFLFFIGCGYTLSPFLSKGLFFSKNSSSLFIQSIENPTFYPLIESFLRRELQHVFENHFLFTVLSEKEKSDLTLVTHILSIQREYSAFSPLSFLMPSKTMTQSHPFSQLVESLPSAPFPIPTQETLTLSCDFSFQSSLSKTDVFFQEVTRSISYPLVSPGGIFGVSASITNETRFQDALNRLSQDVAEELVTMMTVGEQ